MASTTIIEEGCFTLGSRTAINNNFAAHDTALGLVVNDPANIATNSANITTLQGQVGAGRVYHAKYDFAVDGGATGLITPATNSVLPINFVIQNVSINSITAVLAAGGAATISVGLSAGGGGAAAILAALTKASFGANAFVQGIPVPQDVTKWIKMSAAGSLTMTVATNALTAGTIEFYIQGFQSAS